MLSQELERKLLGSDISEPAPVTLRNLERRLGGGYCEVGLGRRGAWEMLQRCEAGHQRLPHAAPLSVRTAQSTARYFAEEDPERHAEVQRQRLERHELLQQKVTIQRQRRRRELSESETSSEASSRSSQGGLSAAQTRALLQARQGAARGGALPPSGGGAGGGGGGGGGGAGAGGRGGGGGRTRRQPAKKARLIGPAATERNTSQTSPPRGRALPKSLGQCMSAPPKMNGARPTAGDIRRAQASKAVSPQSPADSHGVIGVPSKKSFVSYRRMSILQKHESGQSTASKFNLDDYKESLGKARLRFPTVTKATDAEINELAKRNSRRNHLRSQRLDAMYDQAMQHRTAMRRAGGVPDAVGSVIPTPREIHSEVEVRRRAATDDSTEKLNLPYLNANMKLVYSL